MREREEYARSDPASVRGQGHGMSPLELHGESALILAKVLALPEAERFAVVAMYGGKNERLEAVAHLVSHLMPLIASDLPNKQTAMVLLLHWTARAPSIREIAQQYEVSYRKVCRWRMVVASHLTPILARAITRLEDSLFGPGGYEQE